MPVLFFVFSSLGSNSKLKKSIKNGIVCIIHTGRQTYQSSGTLARNMPRKRRIMQILLTPFRKLVNHVSLKIKLMSMWGYSSAGRALDWQSRGRRFDPD